MKRHTGSALQQKLPAFDSLLPKSSQRKLDELLVTVDNLSHNLGEFKFETASHIHKLMEDSTTFNKSLHLVHQSVNSVQNRLQENAFFSAFVSACSHLTHNVRFLHKALTSIFNGDYPHLLHDKNKISSMASQYLRPSYFPHTDPTSYRVSAQFENNGVFKILFAVPCSSTPYTISKITPLPNISAQAIPNVQHTLIAINSNNHGYFPLSNEMLTNAKGSVLPRLDTVMYSIDDQTCGWSLLTRDSTNCSFNPYMYDSFTLPLSNGLLFSVNNITATYSCPANFLSKSLTLNGAGLVSGGKGCTLTLGNSGQNTLFLTAIDHHDITVQPFKLLAIPPSVTTIMSSFQDLQWSTNKLSKQYDSLKTKFISLSSRLSDTHTALIATAITLSIVLIVVLAFFLYHFCYLRQDRLNACNFVDYCPCTSWRQTTPPLNQAQQHHDAQPNHPRNIIL